MRRRKAMDMMHFKWIADGLKKWDDVINVLKEEIKFIKYLQKLGCKIEQKVDNGHLEYSIPKNKVQEYCKKFKMNEEDLYPFEEK